MCDDTVEQAITIVQNRLKDIDGFSTDVTEEELGVILSALAFRSELKPCPFCGGKAELKPFSGDGNNCMGLEYAHVSCTKCRVNGITVQATYDDNRHQVEAVNLWNRRAV